jgi:hypothetical protein
MAFARLSFLKLRTPLIAALAAAVALPLTAQRQYTPITTGTSLEAIADPSVPRPHTKHCEVTLLTNQAFADFNNKNFTFTPPAQCPGPWAKVIFTADFSISPGVQYDRTGQVFFGNVNIYFGTTAEPLQSQTDTWHVERDLTDYSSLFKTAQSGYAILGNIVDASLGLTSTIYGTFKLEFYEADFFNPAPKTANLLLPLPNNGSALLNNGNPTLSETFTLPTNTESAYIDVLAQSQNQEEQWFLCLPSSVASAVGVCGNTAFRQVDVSIDGQPAGVAPVYPWIYTGGVDPGLWIPIPGVQTLNLLPYRIDLSPFAALLSNGQPHTVDVTVYNAFQYFTMVATLAIYEDHGSSQVTGAVTENTLGSPNPTVVNNVSFNSSGVGGGTAIVTNSQNFTIAGYVNTSHGRVNTKVEGSANFSNNQSVTSTATTFGQSVVQSSTVNEKTTTQNGPLFTTQEHNVSYPFTLGYLETLESNDDIEQVSNVDQNFQSNEINTLEGFPLFHSNLSNEVTSKDTATFVPTPTGYGLGPNSGQASNQNYFYKDSFGQCYSRQLAASNNILNTVTDGQGCPRF